MQVKKSFFPIFFEIEFRQEHTTRHHLELINRESFVLKNDKTGTNKKQNERRFEFYDISILSNSHYFPFSSDFRNPNR
ncbi:hypothetical protein CH375_14755 [Leptospira ellisii]|uniref:Uncharacterized protein n=1 Tax=Leptospira ellisii TaxID=2023197 RepID=A0A2N0BIH9_9LEPT|nr:hypothetical protein CH379_20015 [Leptospira ellisii]PKA03816.1 hypothetical protein CH375_14755 [Leptospira ellisii]